MPAPHNRQSSILEALSTSPNLLTTHGSATGLPVGQYEPFLQLEGTLVAPLQTCKVGTSSIQHRLADSLLSLTMLLKDSSCVHCSWRLNSPCPQDTDRCTMALPARLAGRRGGHTLRARNRMGLRSSDVRVSCESVMHRSSVHGWFRNAVAHIDRYLYFPEPASGH